MRAAPVYKVLLTDHQPSTLDDRRIRCSWQVPEKDINSIKLSEADRMAFEMRPKQLPNDPIFNSYISRQIDQVSSIDLFPAPSSWCLQGGWIK